MSKETTPMQELIESVGNMAQGLNEDELYDYVIRKATQLLEKEKQVVVDAHFDSEIAIANIFLNSLNEDELKEAREQAEQYYNEKFNQA